MQRVTDARVVVDEIVAKAEKTLNDPFNAQGDQLKAVLGDLVDSVELRFTEGWKGKRRTRPIAAGHVVLKTDLTLGVSGRQGPSCGENERQTSSTR